jgi:hypothetical protein
MRRFVVTLGAAVLAFVPSTAFGGGSTIPACNGKVATIVGNRALDRLYDTKADGEVLQALGSVNDGRQTNDRIVMIADEHRNELACGGPGRDYMRNEVYGAKFMSGGGGPDVLWGWGKLVGGDGDDVIFVTISTGRHAVFGGPGDDLIEKAQGPFAQRSPYGAHLRVYGGDGDDTIVTAAGGTDQAHGGDGFDTCVVDQNDVGTASCERIILVHVET